MQLLESVRQRALIKLNTYNRRIHIFVKIREKVSLKKKIFISTLTLNFMFEIKNNLTRKEATWKRSVIVSV